jgi:hypothetical protein
MFGLGPNSVLVLNNLTRVHSQVNAMGLQAIAQISS